MISKTWNYTPLQQDSSPRILTVCATRSRVVAGGAYFRSVKLGNDANLISIQISQNTLIVHDIKLVELSTNVSIVKCNLEWNEQVRFDGVSIFKDLINHSEQVISSTQISNTNKVFNGNLNLEFTNPYTIKPKIRIYPLISKSAQDTETQAQVSGFDLTVLQQMVADDEFKIVEIPPRIGGVSWDVQAEGSDALVLSPFGRVFLKGGSGLPAAPNSLNTGPSRTLVHLNYSETYDGGMGTVNAMYEWRGNNEVVGSWELF